MKRFIFAWACGFLLTAALPLCAQHHFTLKGKLNNESLEGEKVSLSYTEGAQHKLDTIRIRNGMFEFKGTVSEPVKATVSTKIIRKPGDVLIFAFSDQQTVYIDGGTIQLEGKTIETAVIKGGASQDDLTILKAQLQPGIQEEKQNLAAISKAREANDTAGIQAARNRIPVLKAIADSIELAFIQAHPASYVSLNMVADRATPKSMAEDRQGVAAMYAHLAERLKNTATGKAINSKIEFSTKLAVGMPSIDFTMKDTLGKPVSLSSFRGKYVLLDFWASWCVPCRFENPGVVKAYNRFKDKNFTVMAVSLDKQDGKQAWIDAINKDKLTWTHVSDLVGFTDNTAVKAYGVYSIPMNYLIDPKGIIVGVNLRGEALGKMLEKVIP